MKHLLTIVFAAFFGTVVQAADVSDSATETDEAMPPKDAVELNLNDFLWVKRPIVVFADTPADPRYVRQLELLSTRVEALEERDVVVLVDTDPAAMSVLREKLRPRGFMLVVIGKDGGVKLRKPFPWDVRELSHAIDKMPLRQQELREKRAAASSTDG